MAASPSDQPPTGGSRPAHSADERTISLAEKRIAQARMTSGADVALAEGTILGRHRVLRLLGCGAFGQVYLARDEQLDRPVAIKVPRRGRFASEASVDRFLAEARTAAQLEHPGIVSVHDVGRSDDGRPFIVMHYVEGRSLGDRMRSARLDHAEAVEIVLHVAEAVHFAHQRGVVHRDLKPGNILLDSHGRPQVADFGLAVHETTQRDHAGEFSGTVPYMAPEQVRGETHRLDGRTDVWALGVILYEMLTGRRPFNGETGAEVADEIEHREPKPLRQIDDRIPAELERICLHAMAKPIADRYPTAGDLARDLRRWLRPASSVRRWLAAVVAGVIVLAAVLGWYGARKFYPGPPVHSRIDVLIWSSTDPARQRVSLRDPGALPVRPGDQIRVEANLDRPMHVYVLWIDGRGRVLPLFPWLPGRWEMPSGADAPRARVSLPERSDRGWPMEGAPGMETVMLLARDTPLPPDINLAQLLSNSQSPSKGIQDSPPLAEFDQGRVVEQPRSGARGPALVGPMAIDDPVLQGQKELAEKLAPHFRVLRSVRFANAGEPASSQKRH